jgi:hypothetical protein
LAATPAAAEPGCAPQLKHRWVYCSANLLVDRNVDSTVALIERAAKAGYNGIALADSKFMRWGDLPKRYTANVTKVRDACRKNRLACVPCVMPIGYSASLLAHDPNLAAGLPVKNAPFVVRGRRIIPARDGAKLANGSFEQWRKGVPAGWRFADQPGKVTFRDTRVVHAGKSSLRMQDIARHSPEHGHGRVMQVVKVRPFRYYHLAAMVRTEDFAAAEKVRIAVLAKGGAPLNYYQPRVAPTQDWKRVHVCFNSLGFDEVRLYLGVWGGKGGKIWWDDVRIEPGGLVNVVRRPAAPLTMTSADGKTAYVEGRDFAGASDPKLGRGRWSGDFTIWHEPPAMAVPGGSRLSDGQTVLLSYYHTAIIHRGQVMCDMTEPKVYEILAWQAAQVRRHLAPDGYFMQHDEIRVQGWEPAFSRRQLTPGGVLAENVRRCVATIRKADPAKPIYVWSDMFDPHHNARKTGRYYLVAGDGPWHGSWEGLAKDVVIVNWHGHAKGRRESLSHFARRGHAQILAGYYDGPVGRIREWLADAAAVEGGANVVGVMYTTWRHSYDDLERFAAELRKPLPALRAAPPASR